MHQKDAGSIPGQGSYEKQLIDVPFSLPLKSTQARIKKKSIWGVVQIVNVLNLHFKMV